jgi:hypothetical protein
MSVDIVSRLPLTGKASEDGGIVTTISIEKWTRSRQKREDRDGWFIMAYNENDYSTHTAFPPPLCLC